MNKEIKHNIFNWKFLLGSIFSIYLLWIVFEKFEIHNFYKIILNANFAYILFAILILLFSVYLRSLRWKLLFHSNDEINTRILFDIQLIGYFANNVLPLRIGEVIKAYFVGNEYNISKSKVFGTIILERVLDMLGVIFLILISLLFSNYKYDLINNYLFLSIVVALLLLSYVLKNFRFKNLGGNFVLKIINDLIYGFTSLNNKNGLLSFFYTALIWICYILIVFFTQLAINFQLDLLQSIFILLVSTFSLAIPSLPASIGIFEASVIYALTLLGINNNNVEFSIFLHSVTFFPYTIIGGYFFFKFYFNENKKIKNKI